MNALWQIVILNVALAIWVWCTLRLVALIISAKNGVPYTEALERVYEWLGPRPPYDDLL